MGTLSPVTRERLLAQAQRAPFSYVHHHKAAAPLVRWLQAEALRGYLRAVADDVNSCSNERSRSCA